MSNAPTTDQIRYCERCGISFLWSVEEQRELRRQGEGPGQGNHAAPIYCAGCRLLLPAPGRERGLVKWYNHRKRYGFLARRDQPEIFAHGSDIEGARGLRPGDLVEFSVAAGERGPSAKAITVLAHGEPPIPD